MNEQVSEVLYRRLKAVQRQFGMARLELGVLLEVFRNNEGLWRGRASSFNAFLEEERIQQNGAAQFMRVAKRFVLDLRLSEAELGELACVNFRSLDLAAKVITEENKDEIIGLLTCLGERDARAALGELADETLSCETLEERTPRMPAPVGAVLRKYRDLPDDYRMQVLDELQRAGRKRGGDGQAGTY